MIKQGQTRIVFLIGKYAIKVPNFLKGRRQFLYGWISNDQEKEWSGRNEYLLPVIYSLLFGLIIIMPKAKVIINNLDKDIFHKITNSLGKYPKVDYKPDTFGIWKGKVYVLDYGTTV